MVGSIRVSASLQDYLETILILSKQNEEVRVTDIADELDVAKSSVHQAVTKLKRSGLVNQVRYGSLALTKEGFNVASRVKEKHDILVKFFVEVLGVNRDVSTRDACLIEHSISKTTIDKLVRFMDDYTKNNN